MRRLITSLLGISLLLSVFLFTNGCERVLPIRTYVIGRDRSWTPLNFLGKETNMLGFTDDLIYSIAEVEDINIDVGASSRIALVENLQRGAFDAIITFDAPTRRLRERYEFSNSFFDLGPVLVVPIDSDATSLEDMIGKVVGIHTRDQIIYDVNVIPEIIFTPFENILFAFRNVAEGHLDGLIMDAFPAREYIESFYKGRLKAIPPPLTDHGLRLMALKTPAGIDLINHFNDGLQKLKDNSDYKGFLEKWRLGDLSTYTGVPEEEAQ